MSFNGMAKSTSRPDDGVTPTQSGESAVNGDPVSTPEGTDQQQSQQSAPDGKDTSGTTSSADGFKAPATQEELNRIIADRVARAKSQFADYGDLKKKAEQFDAIAEAQKTETQRAIERAESAERRAQELESKQQVADWKSQIAKEVGVPASALRGTTEEDLRAHAEELKQLLPDPNARNNGNGAFVPAEGRDTGNGGSDPRAQFGSIIQTLRGK